MRPFDSKRKSGFVSVSPPKGDENPRLNYEDPSQVVLAYSPEGERIAALKVFGDEWTGDTFGTLYTPQYVVRMQRRGAADQGEEREQTIRSQNMTPLPDISSAGDEEQQQSAALSHDESRQSRRP